MSELKTDAIERCIHICDMHAIMATDDAEDELSALITLAKVRDKGCQCSDDEACEFVRENEKLKRQLAEAKLIISGKTFSNFEIEQARREGYELCVTNGWKIKEIDGKNVAQFIHYEEAISDDISQGIKK